MSSDLNIVISPHFLWLRIQRPLNATKAPLCWSFGKLEGSFQAPGIYLTHFKGSLIIISEKRAMKMHRLIWNICYFHPRAGTLVPWNETRQQPNRRCNQGRWGEKRPQRLVLYKLARQCMWRSGTVIVSPETQGSRWRSTTQAVKIQNDAK
jgi:hypothetical protein